jgi:hypothetical protein
MKCFLPMVCGLSLIACRGPTAPRELSPGELRWSVASLDFGALPLGTPYALEVEATNAGELPVVSPLRVDGPFRLEPADVTLERGESRRVTVTFTPERLGAVSAQVDTGTSAGLELRGVGLGPCVAGLCQRSTFDLSSRRCVETPADDGDACTAACLTGVGTCRRGSCVGAATAACDDRNACTLDGCTDDGACLHVPLPAPAPRSPCETWVCDATRGFEAQPIDDGTLCGAPTCSTARVCIDGRCEARATSNAPDDCRYRSVCTYHRFDNRELTCASTVSGRLRCWGAPEFLGRDGGSSLPGFVAGASNVQRAVCPRPTPMWLDGDGGLWPVNPFQPAFQQFRDVRPNVWTGSRDTFRALTTDGELVSYDTFRSTRGATGVEQLCALEYFLRADGGVFKDTAPDVPASPRVVRGCAGFNSVFLHPDGTATQAFDDRLVADGGATAVGSGLAGPVVFFGTSTRNATGPWPFAPVVLTEGVGNLCGLSVDGALACTAAVAGTRLSARPDLPLQVDDGGLRWIGAGFVVRVIAADGGGLEATTLGVRPPMGQSTLQPLVTSLSGPLRELSSQCALAGTTMECRLDDGGTARVEDIVSLAEPRFSGAQPSGVTVRGELVDPGGRVLDVNLAARPPGTPGSCRQYLDGGVSCSNTAVALPPGARLVSLSSSGGCFLTDQLRLFCFSSTSIPPQERPMPLGVRLVAGHARKGCAVIGTNGVRCWGLGQQFETVAIDEPITQLSVDDDQSSIQTCVLTQSGRGLCWGANTFGQLGVAPHDGRTVTPVLE